MTPDATIGILRDALETIHEALCMNHTEKCGSFTCEEAEATHAAYLALGMDVMAEQFMTAHAYADEPGDDHVFIDRGLGIGDGGDRWRYATDEEKGP